MARVEREREKKQIGGNRKEKKKKLNDVVLLVVHLQRLCIQNELKSREVRENYRKDERKVCTYSIVFFPMVLCSNETVAKKNIITQKETKQIVCLSLR